MAKITKDEVKHVADLARLSISEEEADKFAQQLDEIIRAVELLKELDTDGVEPTTHVLNISNVMREDEVRPSLSQEEIFGNAPDHLDGQFKVPSIIE